MKRMKIKISKEVSLPIDVVTQTIAILAKRRAGKSYTMRKLVEQLLTNDQQVILVDPKGDQWGIRSSADGKKPGYPIVILGGEHGDAPLEVNAGEVVAKLVAEERVSVLLDLSIFRKHEIATFMTAFLENLYRLKAQEVYRTPVMLVIDEADAIAPQKPQKGEERMLGAAEDIVRRGGQRGIGCALITQRSAVLNKNVLTQAQMLIVLRTIAPQDLSAMKAWIDVHGTLEEGKTLMESLPSLPIGDAWFWSPGWPTDQGIFQRSHILPIETFDSGATPKPGQKKVVPKNLADVDLDALKKQMSATIEKAKNENPTTLKKKIAELERELITFQNSKVTNISATPVGVSQWAEIGKKFGYWEFFVKKELIANDKKWEIQIKEVNKQLRSIAATMARAKIMIPDSLPIFEIKGNDVFPIISGNPVFSKESLKIAEQLSLEQHVEKGMTLAKQTEYVDLNGDAVEITGPEQRVLNAIAWCESIDYNKPPNDFVCFLSGYSHPRSTGYTNPRGYLKAKGLVDYSNGSVFLTLAGRAAAEKLDRPLSQEEFHNEVLKKLDGPERKLLKPLLERYPQGISNTELCSIAGYMHERSTGYTNPRGRLRSFGLIEYADGEVKARDILFLK